jgi:2-keto-3-deoxy-L-rhamnonate aldolase RhmA
VLAIQNLPEICSVPGLDAVLIGPHDLSCSLGIPEQYSHPRFDEAGTFVASTFLYATATLAGVALVIGGIAAATLGGRRSRGGAGRSTGTG